MAKKIPTMLDKSADVWEELTSTQTSRTGQSAARVASALDNDVAPEVLALQATLNSKKNNPDAPLTFTKEEITAVGKWYVANRTRSALTKQQTGALIREQRAQDGDGLEPSFS